MYVNPNYRTKKALVEALKSGSYIQVFQPNADLQERLYRVMGRFP